MNNPFTNDQYKNSLGQYGLGNIDLYARPQVKMPDGKVATVKSMSFNDGSKEILIPTVSDDGRIMTDNEAIDNYYKTGKYLGKFNTVDEANKYAEQLHNEQDRYYNKNRTNVINGLQGGLNMDNYFMNDLYKSYMNPQDYSRIYESYTGLPGRTNSYQQLGAMAQSLMGGSQDPRLQQLSQMLQMYQQGL